MLAQAGSPFLGARYLAAFNEEVDMPLDTRYICPDLLGGKFCLHSGYIVEYGCGSSSPALSDALVNNDVGT